MEKVINKNIKKLNKQYGKDILELNKIYDSIYQNIELNIKIEPVIQDRFLPSFYKIYLLFSRNIIKKEYQNYLLEQFDVSKNDMGIIELEIKKINDVLKKIKVEITNDIELKRKDVNKINNLFENKTPKIKKILTDIIFYNIDLLPDEIKNLKNIDFLKHHSLLYNDFISFDIIESIRNMKCFVKVIYENKLLYVLYCKNKKEISSLKKENMFKKIATRLLFISKYVSVGKLPMLRIYYTHHKKTINYLFKKDIIYNPDNINTAATDNRNMILIWRKEELLKSILHETVHFYNLDIKNKSLVSKYNKYFIDKININKDNYIDIGESYTETISNFLNCIFYINENQKKETNILKMFNENLMKEIQFSIFQSSKILYYQKYKSFNDLFIKNKKTELNQTTNMFSYHIIKSSLLFNIFDVFNNNSKDKLALNLDTFDKKKIDGFDKIIKTSFETKNKWNKSIDEYITFFSKKKTKKLNKFNKKNIKSLKMTYFS